MGSPSMAVLVAVLAFGVLFSRPCAAQDEPGLDQTLISREQWLANGEEARRRIDQMRREGRSFAPPPQSVEEAAREASQRALEDDSLRAGDIVSTDRGLLVFKGRSSGEPGLNDFAPLNSGARKP